MCNKTKKTIMKQMTEQENQEFEAEWRSGLKSAVWFGLLTVAL